MSAASLRQAVDLALVDMGLSTIPSGGGGKVVRTEWAEDQPCFGLRTYLSGRRVYIVQARMGGRVRTVTIANALLVSRSKALDVARRVLLRAQTGSDPAQERERTRAIPPFDDFLDLYWDRMAPKWKPSTRKTHDIYRRQHLEGAFGRKTVDKVTVADVASWFARTAKNGGPGGANRALDILRAAFSKAEAWGLRSENSNPTLEIKRYPQQRHGRFLRTDEIERLGAILDQEAVSHPLQVAAIRLLLLTGCRSSEITGLMRSEVVGNRLKLTDSKTGPRTVWLGAEAQALLSDIARIAAREGLFVRPGEANSIALGDYWRDARQRHGLGNLRLHDLRHSFASHAASLSESLPMIGRLLGHSEIQSTARYAHLDCAELMIAAQAIGDALESHIGA